jgi:hypothetical protein
MSWKLMQHVFLKRLTVCETTCSHPRRQYYPWFGLERSEYVRVLYIAIVMIDVDRFSIIISDRLSKSIVWTNFCDSDLVSYSVWTYLFIGTEVLTAMVRKSSVFCDIIPCIPFIDNRIFGGTCRLHLQYRRIGRGRHKRQNRRQAGGGNGGSMIVLNVTRLSTDNAALCPSR